MKEIRKDFQTFGMTKEEREEYYKLKKGGFSTEEIENIIRGEREVEDEML